MSDEHPAIASRLQVAPAIPRPEGVGAARIGLTRREQEVLRSVADGKTFAQIADDLAISVNTVNFHVKNVANKLGTSGRPATVTRAQVLHLLD